MSGSDTVHATTVAIDRRGVMLRGPSGAGKSDLALRLIDAGAELVADDRTVLQRREDSVIADCLPQGEGLLEIRGVGIPRLPSIAESVPVALVVDLHPTDQPIPRLPEPATETVLGVPLPRVDLHATEASAPIKVRMALRHGVGVMP